MNKETLCTGCGATVTQKAGSSILLWFDVLGLSSCAPDSVNAGGAHYVSLPPVAIAPEPQHDDSISTLRCLKLWLERHLETNIMNRSTGKGGHDGNGNSWAVVAIPVWDARQRIKEINAAISRAEGGKQ